MATISRLGLFFWTARYLKPSQIWYRCNRNLRLLSWQISGRKALRPTQWKLADFHPLYIGLRDISCAGLWSEKVSPAVEKAKETAIRRFHFLNKTVDFPVEPGWHDRNMSRLWRFHLHYFGFVNDLLVWSAAEEDNPAYRTFRNLVTSWIDSNQTLGGDGWHPYTLSERLVNWLNAIPVFGSQLGADQEFRQSFISSLYGQCQFLFDNLELDVRGNHLVKNLRALLWASVAFKGDEPKRWFKKALALLRRELDEQVLSDGGHFERTPGYHLIVFKDCLEIALWLKRNRDNVPEWLDETLRRMLDYIIGTLAPDGRVSLLKDTTWDSAPDPNDLLAAGALYFDEPSFKKNDDFHLYPLLLFGMPAWEKFKKWPTSDSLRTSVALQESGHFIMRDASRDEYLIFDAGKPCPDYLPAHAHADLLSYELQVGSQRVVVDSGVYEYSAGFWRDYFRSTRAHNTVEVAGQDQSEVWSSFRVARRARPGPVVWQETDHYVLLQATHDGYRRLSVPVIHRRTLVWQKTCFWLVVDELQGKGWVEAVSHVHLHPELGFNPLGDSAWKIEGSPLSLWLTAFGENGYSIVRGQKQPFLQGWYSERFGEVHPNSVLSLGKEGNLSFCFGYVISTNEPAQVQHSGDSKGQLEIIVIHNRSSHRLRIGLNELSYS
jgi:uncharacterized heparinase superfamily protein